MRGGTALIVILDLEWIEDDGKHLTQLYAARVDDAWNTVDCFDRFVNPGTKYHSESAHMAYGGADIAQFINSISTNACMASFTQWLEASDEVWVWAKSNLRFLQELINTEQISLTNPVYSTAKAVRHSVLGNAPSAMSPYELLEMLKVPTPYPEHRSANDVEALRKLFKTLNMPRDTFSSRIDNKTPPNQRAINAQMIARTQYNYLFLKGSEVFHRRGCKLCLNAKGKEYILGSVHYETAAKKRRPCKVCNPQPESATASQALTTKASCIAPNSHKSSLNYETLGEVHSSEALLRESFPDKLEKQEKSCYDSRQGEQPWPREIIKTKMVTGAVLPIRRSRIVGWCKCDLHPGALTKALMAEHECLGKQCFFLVRNNENPFWAELAQKEKNKEQKKEAKRARKVEKARKASAHQTLLEELQQFLDDTLSGMYIVRIENEKLWLYKIYYVSDNRFADGQCFPDFFEYLRCNYPGKKFLFRHIRDVDGHFVTRDEFFSRRK